MAKAAEDETKPIIENTAPVVKAAKVVYQGIVYDSHKSKPAITCGDVGSVLSLQEERQHKGSFPLPSDCTEEPIVDFILFQEDQFTQFGGINPSELDYKYMSAFVRYIGTSDEWRRVFIEVNKNIELQGCDKAPSHLQDDCQKNVTIFEDHERSRNR